MLKSKYYYLYSERKHITYVIVTSFFGFFFSLINNYNQNKNAVRSIWVKRATQQLKLEEVIALEQKKVEILVSCAFDLNSCEYELSFRITAIIFFNQIVKS